MQANVYKSIQARTKTLCGQNSKTAGFFFWKEMKTKIDQPFQKTHECRF